MKASVVICTHNRKSFLLKSLASVLVQDFDPQSYELIVVDNQSTDGTAEAVENFLQLSSEKSRAKVVKEPRLGLSHARNRGLQEASGDLIIFLDDDAIAPSNWLSSMVSVFDSDPRIAVVGGKVDPLWPEGRAPDWISRDLFSHFSVIDWGVGTQDLASDQWLAGANIGYRRKVIVEVGGFSGKLGRKGKLLLSCEESLLNFQIKKNGHRIIYNGQACVDHYVMPDRMNASWLMQRSFWQGASEAIMSRLIEDRPVTWFVQSKRFARGFIYLGKAFWLKSLVKPGDHRRINSGIQNFHQAGLRLGILLLPWI